MNDGTIIIGTKIDTSGIDSGIDDIESEVNNIDFTDGLEKKVGGIGNALKSVASKVANSFGQVGKVLYSITMLLTKLSFGTGAIVGIVGVLAGAFAILLQAIEKIKEENSEIVQKIQYIVFIITQGVAPAIEGVANFIAKVLNFVLDGIIKIIAYIGYVIKFLTGFNIFKNAGVDKFQQSLKKADDNAKGVKKSTSGIAKNLKEARKQLAGFDEMNILTKDGGTSGGGGVNLGNLGGIGELAEADFKLSEALDINNIKIPQWLTDMMEFLTNPTQFLKPITGFFKGTNFEMFGEGLANMINGVISIFVGFQETLIGVGETLVGIFTLNPSLIWNGIQKIVDGVYHIINGLFITIIGAFETIVGLIDGVLKSVGQFMNKYVAEPIRNVLSGVWNWVKINVIDKIVAGFNSLRAKVVTAFNNVKNGITSTIGGVANWIKINVIDKITNTFKGIWNTISKSLNTTKDEINKVFKKINPLKLAWGIGKNIVDFGKNLWDYIKKPITDMVDKINKELKKVNPINLAGQGIKKVGSFFGNLFGAKGMVIKYAKGGIINRPSKGVPLPLGGEHGMEGVVPLTDSQQMMLLGEAIGKYITINANITNSMNGRIISRELQKIQNEQSFASNRW